MTPSCKYRFVSSTTTVTYTYLNDQTTPEKTDKVLTPMEPCIRVADHISAATKIQSAYKAHIIRTLYRKISFVNSEADQLQRAIQQQETVDAIRNDEREKLRINEALMRLLLRLDSVPGVDPTVREARRKVSRRIVGLQEIVDGICGGGESDWCGEFVGDWDEVVAEMEKKVCLERGGEEMERYCAEYLGFRCLQRFLSEP
ncbi:BAG family molecular chaperone regulator 5, mitochondrial [Euphorbia lathyris]|uniref:BAG family molecular chaperone regulator 5, mitochondrial n=1 Tax=Euphorbia lathyris TaxID=212925 RepID=UPI00331320C4